MPLLPDASLGAGKGIDRAFNVDASSVPVADNWVGPISVSGTAESDVYQLVIFYPSQPASMIDLEVVRDAQGRTISQTPVEADDSALSLGALPSGYTLEPPVASSGIASASRGQYGLGESYAFTTSVRPFRLVFESATIFRLEP